MPPSLLSCCRHHCCCCWCHHSCHHSGYCYGCCCHGTAAAGVASAAAPTAVITALAPAIVAPVIPRLSVLVLAHSFTCAHCHLYQPICEPWPTHLHSLVPIPPPSACVCTHRSLHSFVLALVRMLSGVLLGLFLGLPLSSLWYFTYNRIVSIL